MAHLHKTIGISGLKANKKRAVIQKMRCIMIIYCLQYYNPMYKLISFLNFPAEPIPHLEQA
jgi:hypothetical protein